MTAANLVTVWCDTCGPGGSELATANTAATARRQLTAQGWRVNVREVTADRRLDFCPLHRIGKEAPVMPTGNAFIETYFDPDLVSPA
jgi:hypothetical protein